MHSPRLPLPHLRPRWCPPRASRPQISRNRPKPSPQPHLKTRSSPQPHLQTRSSPQSRPSLASILIPVSNAGRGPYRAVLAIHIRASTDGQGADGAAAAAAGAVRRPLAIQQAALRGPDSTEDPSGFARAARLGKAAALQRESDFAAWLREHGGDPLPSARETHRVARLPPAADWAGKLRPLRYAENHWRDGVPKWKGDRHSPEQWDYAPPA